MKLANFLTIFMIFMSTFIYSISTSKDHNNNNREIQGKKHKKHGKKHGGNNQNGVINQGKDNVNQNGTNGGKIQGNNNDFVTYCPSKDDLKTAYGKPNIYDQGWTIHGPGGVASKSSFNVLGGYIEYDIDLSNTKGGINANVYSISPTIPQSGFTGSAYCDGSRKKGKSWCVEMDWIESNGGCGGATTQHNVPGHGKGCNAGGCAKSYHFNGNNKFHMRIEYDTEGRMTVHRGNDVISYADLGPKDSDRQIVYDAYKNKGALIYSSQWKGWSPLNDCPNDGKLGDSVFSISNLRIHGKVLQGPTPRTC